MRGALLLALVILFQAVPVTVLATSPCRACDHAGAMRAGVHCPLKKPATGAHRCHDSQPAGGAKLRSVGCTCGEGASQALRSGDPVLPPRVVVAKRFEPVVPTSPASTPSPLDRELPPPDRPPRPSILL